MFELLIPPPPDPNAQFDILYTDSHRHIVMAYDLGRFANDKAYFTDGHPVFDITDTEASALANIPQGLGKFAKAHGLVQLKISFGALATPDVTITGSGPDHALCQWPYDSSYKISKSSGMQKDVVFVKKLSVPRTHTYQLWCENGPGPVELMTEYESLGPVLFLDANGKPLLAFGHPAAVFRWNDAGTEIGPRLGSDIIVVPSSIAEDFRSMAAEGELGPQDAINQFEAQIHAIETSTPAENR